MQLQCDRYSPGDITPAEVEFFHEHGWAKYEAFISAELASELLGISQEILAKARSISSSGSRDLGEFWYTWDTLVFEARRIRHEAITRLAVSKAMGEIAARLIDRKRLTDEIVPVRCLGALLFCKTQSGSISGQKIPYHQDGPAFYADRPGLVTAWIALHEVRPEQGAMRFLDGSHKEGSLGRHVPTWPVERYPKLIDRYSPSPELHYNPGDATVHDGFTLHYSPENSLETPRWGLLCMYIAADVQFDGKEYEYSGMPEPYEQYPIVYPA